MPQNLCPTRLWKCHRDSFGSLCTCNHVIPEWETFPFVSQSWKTPDLLGTLEKCLYTFTLSSFFPSFLFFFFFFLRRGEASWERLFSLCFSLGKKVLCGRRFYLVKAKGSSQSKQIQRYTYKTALNQLSNVSNCDFFIISNLLSSISKINFKSFLGRSNTT